MPNLTYLYIRGTLTEDMVYRPQQGQESSRPSRQANGNAAFELVLLDGNDRVLVSVTPEVLARGCRRAEDPLRFRVRGCLPLHPNGTKYELRRGEIKLHKGRIAPNQPKISAPRCSMTKEGLAFRWQAARRKGITYSIMALMESGRRFTLVRGLAEPSYTVDVSRIPASGNAKLFIVANDGVRSSEVEAASIEVPARPPTVHIIAPVADSSLPFGQPLSVLGCCLDMGGEPCSSKLAVWLLDGEKFASGTWTAAVDQPQPGIHKLTLEYGEKDTRVETSVKLEIETPDADYRHWEELMAEATDLRGKC